MPGFTVTRGLGGSPSSMLSLGFISDAKRLIKGATRFAKKLAADIKTDINISAMLVSMNGKELVKPIFSKVTKIFVDNDISIRVLPKKLVLRKSERIKITTGNVKVRNKNNERD